MLPSRFGKATPSFIHRVGASFFSMTARTVSGLRLAPPFESVMTCAPSLVPRRAACAARATDVPLAIARDRRVARPAAGRRADEWGAARTIRSVERAREPRVVAELHRAEARL